MSALWLLVGLVAGYWAKEMYTKLSAITRLFKDRLESPPGVVKPIGIRTTSDSDTGGVLRPNPNQVALDAMIERDRKIKDMSI